MSNLLKYGNVIIKNDNKMVIDSNKLLEQLIAEQKQHNNYAKRAEAPDADGFICGLNAATVEELITGPELTEEEETRISKVLDDAREQAQSIISDANAQAERILAQARDEGYSQGMESAAASIEKQLQERRDALEQEYADKKAVLQAEYDDMKAHIEPELAEVILEVFSKVTGILAEDKKDLILHLVNNVMSNTEMSREFTIRVSEDDYKYLESNRDLIYGAASSEYNIEICKDIKMSRGQCVIETDAGVFDCSLDIQLENLIEEIKILSCMH